MSRNQITVRKANRQDLEAIKGVLVSCKKNPNERDDAWWHQRIEAGDVLVGEFENEVRGFGAIDSIEVAGFCLKTEISHLYVMKDCRRSGIGAIILEKLEHIAKAKGLTKINLDSTPCAIEFYLKMGYQPENATPMVKQLFDPSTDNKLEDLRGKE